MFKAKAAVILWVQEFGFKAGVIWIRCMCMQMVVFCISSLLNVILLILVVLRPVLYHVDRRNVPILLPHCQPQEKTHKAGQEVNAKRSSRS